MRAPSQSIGNQASKSTLNFNGFLIYFYGTTGEKCADEAKALKSADPIRSFVIRLGAFALAAG
jgi:hypothetical protein